MQQILIIPLLCYLAFLLEYALLSLFGRWSDPDLLLLVIIFFNLYSGIRFSLWAALWGGIFRDCFSTMPFGTNVFVYILCAYFSTFLRRYCYERGSSLSKLFMVFSLVTAHALIMGILHVMIFDSVRWIEVWGTIWLPQVIVTLAVCLFVFEKLADTARLLRFSS